MVSIIPIRRYAILTLAAAALTVLMLLSHEARRGMAMAWFDRYLEKHMGHGGPGPPPAQATEKPRPPFFRPKPEWTPPPVRDPFPSLATSTPPPIPPWNVPKKDLHRTYGLDYKPPLLIGFSRNWPMLLQAVVSYITAGWPPDQIHVVENTGVHRANLDGRLTLQNPYYLNHSQLAALGVRVERTPVLLSFAQLQNFYMHLAQDRGWAHYFWSHMDVLVLSYEAGNELTPPATEPGYKTLYELCLAQMSAAARSGERWAARLFAYDHLTLVNRAAYEDVGGWDALIPYYMTDCDMHGRLAMRGWTLRDARAGIVSDVGSAMGDLRALYRDPGVDVRYVDPNPPVPAGQGRSEGQKQQQQRRREDADNNGQKDSGEEGEEGKGMKKRAAAAAAAAEEEAAPELAYWRRLESIAGEMVRHKLTGERNTWQAGQRGGQGEPYHYEARGIAEAIDVLTEAGREVYRRKWGHQNCDLLGETDLKIGDQWMVEKDWE